MILPKGDLYDLVMRFSALNDVHYAVRQIRLAPMFTITVALTLGLGIGATTAIFSLIHAVMLNSLPVADPNRLYRIGTGKTCCYSNGPQGEWGIFSYDFYQRLRHNSPQFEQIAAFQAEPHILSVRHGDHMAQAQALLGEYVSGNYFETLGVKPFAGRFLTFADDQRNSAPVAVMSYGTWQQDFGGDLSVVNADFAIEGFSFKVIGIAPPGFYGETMSSTPVSLWIPLQTEFLTDANASYNLVPASAWLRVIGRLRAGASLGGAASQLTAFLQHWLLSDAAMMPDHRSELEQLLARQRIEIGSAATGVGEMQDTYGSSLMILLAACTLVLLIACANVANLLLARGMTRRVPMGVMCALGASRKRLMQQTLIESLMLSLLGGIAGLILAILGAHLAVRLTFGRGSWIAAETSLSWPMLGYCATVALLSGICVGTVPAWVSSRTSPMDALRTSGRSRGERRATLRKSLVVAQIAVSLSLLAGATLLTRSLQNIEFQDFGFKTRNRIALRMEEPLAAYSFDHLNVLYRRLQQRLEGLPGVHSASLALCSPFTTHWDQLVVKPGEGIPSVSGTRTVLWNRVSPHYFNTVGQELLAGRDFTEADNWTSRQVAIVNQSFVRRFFPNADPLGEIFGFGGPANSKDFQIVGVVRDAKYMDPGEDAGPMVFAPLAQSSKYTETSAEDNEKWSHFITGAQLWVDGDPGKIEPKIRAAFRDVDPNFAIVSIQPLRRQVDALFDQQRLLAQLSGLFGVLALVLASIGLYGLTAYNVARRTSEIGVRMAIGANRMQIVLLVSRGAFLQSLIGLVAGLPMAYLVGRLLQSRLYHLNAAAPWPFVFPALTLLVSASAASFLPALRAASIEPLEALRVD